MLKYSLTLQGEKKLHPWIFKSIYLLNYPYNAMINFTVIFQSPYKLIYFSHSSLYILHISYYTCVTCDNSSSLNKGNQDYDSVWNPILIRIDFFNFISPFSPYFYFWLRRYIKHLITLKFIKNTLLAIGNVVKHCIIFVFDILLHGNSPFIALTGVFIWPLSPALYLYS